MAILSSAVVGGEPAAAGAPAAASATGVLLAVEVRVFAVVFEGATRVITAAVEDAAWPAVTASGCAVAVVLVPLLPPGFCIWAAASEFPPELLVPPLGASAPVAVGGLSSPCGSGLGVPIISSVRSTVSEDA